MGRGSGRRGSARLGFMWNYRANLAFRTPFESYGRLIGSLRQGPNGATGVRDYLLADLDSDALVAFVTRPTADEPIDHAHEVPRDRYAFCYAAGVPEALASELLRAGRKDGVLPLAQVICSQLWQRACAGSTGSSPRVVTHDDLAALGGFAGALWRHVVAGITAIVPREPPPAPGSCGRPSRSFPSGSGPARHSSG